MKSFYYSAFHITLNCIQFLYFYFCRLLVAEDEERQRNVWVAGDDAIENRAAIMDDILSIGDSDIQGQYGFMGSMLEDAENDILDMTTSCKTPINPSQGLVKVTVSITRESESLSVTKVVSPANSRRGSESLSITRASSRESVVQSLQVKENSNLVKISPLVLLLKNISQSIF
jgi:hypothetical protein